MKRFNLHLNNAKATDMYISIYTMIAGGLFILLFIFGFQLINPQTSIEFLGIVFVSIGLNGSFNILDQLYDRQEDIDFEEFLKTKYANKNEK